MASSNLFRLSEPGAKYLLVVNKGPEAVSIAREGNRWDLLEIYFRPPDIENITRDPSLTDAEHVVFESNRKLRKFAIIKNIFEGNDFWRRYDAIMFADDDVAPVGCAISGIFDLFMETACRIGQPALTHDSYFAHFHTLKNDNFVWRKVTHIDFMCVLMTGDAVSDYLPIMNENVSAFGCEKYWGYYEWKRGTAHAVLDATPMRHSRPVGGGIAYDGLDNPMGEYVAFMARHNLPFYPHLCLGGAAKGNIPAEDFQFGYYLTGCDAKILISLPFQVYAAEEIAALRHRKMHRAHLAYYAFALKASRGKDVVDIGYGVGYGSHFLATHGAKTVIALDIAENAPGPVRKRHQASNLDYRHCLAAENKETSLADVITCFETIDHIEDRHAFLAAIKKALRPGGIAILSTAGHGDKTRPDLHLNEMELNRLKSMLDGYFAHFEIFQANRDFISLVRSAFSYQSDPASPPPCPPGTEGTDHLIAVASDEAINLDVFMTNLGVRDDPYIARLEYDIGVLRKAAETEWQAKLSAARAELAAAKAAYEFTSFRLAAITNSTFWRATSPLRVLAGHLPPEVRTVLRGTFRFFHTLSRQVWHGLLR